MEKIHIQPRELDLLPYYEYEYTVEIYNDIVKERNEEEKKQNSTNEEKYNLSGIQKNLSSFKNPKMPKIKVPKF